MRLFLLLTAVVACLMTSGCTDENIQARTEKLAAFSVDVPEGWATNMPEGIECTRGRCSAGFTKTNSGSRSAVTISVIPSLGKSLQEIIDESTGNQSTHEAQMRIVSQTPTSVEYEGTIRGSDTRLLATIDEKNQEVGVLMIVGKDDALEGIVKSLKFVNERLSFDRPAQPAVQEASQPAQPETPAAK